MSEYRVQLNIRVIFCDQYKLYRVRGPDALAYIPHVSLVLDKL